MKTTNLKVIIHDTEEFPNCFLAGFKFEDGSRATFEISNRKNELSELVECLMWIKHNGYIMVGFNSLGFDYHIIHNILNNPTTFTTKIAADMAQDIIGRQNDDRMYPVQYGDRIIPQLDLFLMNHFDNASKRTSLKKLEANMRMDNIEDLPFPIRHLTYDEMDVLVKYMHHDIDATHIFYDKCKEQVDLRIELKENGLVAGDTLNMSDVKLGEQFFVTRMGRDEFFVMGKKKQTQVKVLAIKDVILPYIGFHNPAFNIMLNQFKSTIWQDGVDFEWPSVTVNDVEYVYGRGGIHACNKTALYESNDEYIIVDLDVTSMYPSIAIVNNIKPQHLTERFTTEYANLKAERVKLPKTSALSKLLKLALNGVFGNSGNKYSIFFDNKYLMSTTVNGQLLITMLIDQLLLMPDLIIIQANTDGVTFRLKRSDLHMIDHVKAAWERDTKLDLEEVLYKKFWCRDVNNFCAEDYKGKIKAKGAYAFPEKESDYDGNWNKNYSCMIVQKVVREVLVNNKDVNDELLYAILSGDVFDFTLLHTNSSGGYLYLDGVKQGKNTRYAVCKDGSDGVIVYPPKGVEGHYKKGTGVSQDEYDQHDNTTWDARVHTKNKSKYTERRVSLVAGRKVRACNNIKDLNLMNIDFEWYADEIKRLTEVFNGQT